MTNIIIMECNTLSCVVSPFHTGPKPIQALVASAFEDKVSRERQRFVFTSSEKLHFSWSQCAPAIQIQHCNFPPFKMWQGQDSAGRELQVIFAAVLVQLKHVRSNFKWVNRQIKVLTVDSLTIQQSLSTQPRVFGRYTESLCARNELAS